MDPKNIIIFTLLIATLCTNATAFKKRAKSKINKSNLPIGLPGCGCQSPLLSLLDCGCRSPILETPYALSPYDIPIGCQPVLDIPNYRYVESFDISPLGYVNPLEMSNFGCLASAIALPGIEITQYELPCGCQGNCGCGTPAIKIPGYPYGSPAVIDVPNCGCQELGLSAYTIGGLSQMIEIPMIISGCGCVGSCGCQNPLACGCVGSCGCQNSLACGCIGPVCGCQGLMSCGCPGPICGCQNSLPCGCPGPCGCQGPSGYQVPCERQSPLACGCQGTCGCQGALSCGCMGPFCGCQSLDVPTCGCVVPGCPCGGKYLRQVTLQPPFI